MGQCGNQIGSEFWPLALNEYGIQSSAEANNKKSLKFDKNDLFSSFQSFFHVQEEHKNVSINSFEDIKKCEVKARVMINLYT